MKENRRGNIMKNKKIVKLMMAFALAGAVFAPQMEKSFASEKDVVNLYTDQNYLKASIELANTINKAKEAKASYKYLNASKIYRDNLDYRLKVAEETYYEIPSTYSSSYLINKLTNARYFLQNTIDDLDGKLANTTDLNEYIRDYNYKFADSDEFKNATYSQQMDYRRLIERAEKFAKDRAYGNSQAVVDNLIEKIKAAKKDIIDSYKNNKARVELNQEIKTSSLLRKKADDYTKSSFESFISTLKLVETSVEDESKAKTIKEYEELREALKKARLALVKVQKTDPDIEKQIKRLEDAIARSSKTVDAAEFLIEKYPNTIKSVRSDLDKLLAKQKKNIEAANKKIAELKGIKG